MARAWRAAAPWRPGAPGMDAQAGKASDMGGCGCVQDSKGQAQVGTHVSILILMRARAREGGAGAARVRARARIRPAVLSTCAALQWHERAQGVQNVAW
jgi:hypothetical protein